MYEYSMWRVSAQDLGFINEVCRVVSEHWTYRRIFPEIYIYTVIILKYIPLNLLHLYVRTRTVEPTLLATTSTRSTVAVTPVPVPVLEDVLVLVLGTDRVLLIHYRYEYCKVTVLVLVRYK